MGYGSVRGGGHGPVVGRTVHRTWLSMIPHRRWAFGGRIEGAQRIWRIRNAGARLVRKAWIDRAAGRLGSQARAVWRM